MVVIPPDEIDRTGLHVCNVAGMRRALAGLSRSPGYVLTDGFPVRGLGVPALAMWKGDEVAACVAAASVVAKVTRDRLMCDLHVRVSGLRVRPAQGLLHARSHAGARPPTGPARSTGCSFANVRRMVSPRRIIEARETWLENAMVDLDPGRSSRR